MLHEIHMTVEPNDEVSAWQEACRKLRIKPLLIQLTQGDYPLQLMSARTRRLSEDEMRSYIEELKIRVADKGFRIIRVKWEVPLHFANLLRRAPLYHECHMKLLLTERQAAVLPRICRISDLHASQNLLAPTAPLQKWYLTARVYEMTISQAQEFFKKKRVEVERFLPVERMDMESAVLDNNRAMDAGWAET